MHRRFAAFSVATLLILWALAGVLGPSRVAAQDDDGGDLLFDMTLDQGTLPVGQAYIRLLRINLDPQGVSPLHTHPGPELWRVETGTITLFVQGPTKLARAPD